MADTHQRYEQMAVGHVLGGLDPVDSAEFRSHLVECRHCRMRVAELRGIASDLEAAEREERVAARVKTEVARRKEEDQEAADGARGLSGRALTLIGALGAVIAIGLLTWSFHLRDVNGTLLDVTAAREQVLSMLASGDQVEAEFHEGVEGIVAVEGAEVALALSGVPPVGTNQWVAVWLVDGEPPHRFDSFLSGAVREGRFATHLMHRGADRLILSIEERPSDGGGLPQEPQGTVLVEAQLP